jgi:hypothetical protein
MRNKTPFAVIGSWIGAFAGRSVVSEYQVGVTANVLESRRHVVTGLRISGHRVVFAASRENKYQAYEH